MFGFRWIGVLFGVLISVTSLQAKVIVLSTGSNSSLDRRAVPLKYADSDAIDFGQAMAAIGGTEPTDVITLQNPTINEFIAGLKSAENRTKFVSSEKFSKFVFFYSGHADERGFHFRDGYFSKNALNAFLERLLVKTKVVILDSCFAGIMTNKGVKTTPGFGVPKMDFDEPTGSIYLTAASSQDLAFESRSMKGGLFSRNLIAGLYGAADGNHDGVVTATELYEYSFRETQLASYFLPASNVQKPEFVAELRGRGAVALSYPSNAQGKVRLTSDLGGSILVASAQGISSFNDVKARGLEQTLSLPVGLYRLQINDGQRSGTTEVAVNSKKLAIVTADDIIWKDVSSNFAAKSPAMEYRHKVGLAYILGFDKGDESGKVLFLTERSDRWQLPTVSFQAKKSHEVPKDQSGNHLLSSLQFMLGFKAPLWHSANNYVQWRLGPEMGIASAKVLHISQDCHGLCDEGKRDLFYVAAATTSLGLFKDLLVLGFGVEQWFQSNGEEFIINHRYLKRFSVGTFVAL